MARPAASCGRQSERTNCWEGAKALGIQVDRLGNRKSSPEKVQLTALLKAATSESNRWLAERLKTGQPASVSHFVRRFRLAGATAWQEFQRALSRVKA